jgi:hypothetical protein
MRLIFAEKDQNAFFLSWLRCIQWLYQQNYQQKHQKGR